MKTERRKDLRFGSDEEYDIVVSEHNAENYEQFKAFYDEKRKIKKQNLKTLNRERDEYNDIIQAIFDFVSIVEQIQKYY